MLQDKRFAWLPALALALAGALTSGCETDVISEPPVGETGLLTALWTVDGTVDPNACFFYGGGPTDFELLVYRGNRLVAEAYTPCEEFGLTLELRTGTYTGFATLVTPDEDPVTTTLPLEDIVIVRDTELTIDIDFPADSFLFF